MIQLNEVSNRTRMLATARVDVNGQVVTLDKETQRYLLHRWLEWTEKALAVRQQAEQTGVQGLEIMEVINPPAVEICYAKQTATKARLEGVDYIPLNGLKYNTHRGVLVFVGRNKKGIPYFKLKDAARDGWTNMRLEGVLSFRPLAPEALTAALALREAS